MYEKICSKLLGELRGEKTQLEMSNLMGYKTNQYYKFEAGLKIFKLKDFINICVALNIPLRDILNDKIDLCIGELSVVSLQDDFIKIWSIQGHTYLKQVLNISDTRFRRLLRGSAELTMMEFLLIVDKVADRLSVFLRSFSSLKVYSEEELPKEKRYDLVDLYMKYPEALVIESAAALDKINQYPDKEKKTALRNFALIDKKKFDEVYDYLIENNYLKVENSKYKFVGLKMSSQFEKRTNNLVKNIWTFLKSISINRIEKTGLYYGTSTRIAPVSDNAKEEINKVLKESYRKISEIIDLDKDKSKSDIFYFRREVIYHKQLEDIATGKLKTGDSLKSSKY